MSTKSRSVATTNFVPLSASDKVAPQGTKIGPVHGNKKLTMSVQLPTAKTDVQLKSLEAKIQSGKCKPLTAAQLEKWFGGSNKDVNKVRRALRNYGIEPLKRTKADKAMGIIRFTGAYARLREFFPGLALFEYTNEQGKKFIGREGIINILAGMPLVGVFGADNREHAETNIKFGPKDGANPAASSQLTSRGIAGVQGIASSIMDDAPLFASGYLSLGGDNGTQMQADVAKAASHDGITIKNKPLFVSVDGTANGEYSDQATVENILDANAHALCNPNGYLFCLMTGNTDDAFAQGGEYFLTYTAQAPDGTKLPTHALTISWGSASTNFTQQSHQRWARIGQASRTMGRIITAATGDNGSKDNTNAATPDSPSDTTGIIGAAGTGITVSGGKVSDLTAWSSSGGGISAAFAPMPEEAKLGLPVSASTHKPGHSASLLADVADPASGPYLSYNGRFMRVGGTSHAAPFIGVKLAHIQARLNNKITDVVGWIYANLGKGIFQMVTKPGSNGDYSAKPGDVINVVVGAGQLKFNEALALAKQQQDGAAA